jgi:hypothetical protein
MVGTLLLTTVVAAQASPDKSSIALTRLDLRIAEMVVEAYEEETGQLPLDEDGCLLLDAPEIDLGSVYGRRIPVKDAWGRPMRFWLVDDEVFLSSDGPDGAQDFDPIRDGDNPHLIHDDLVLTDGDFLDECLPSAWSLTQLGQAMDSYGVDQGAYPGPTGGLVPVSRLEAVLAPIYIRELPALDDWGNPILVYSEPTGYFLVSFGSDGRPDQEYDPGKTGEWPTGEGAVASPWRDVILVNGRLVQWYGMGGVE